MTNTALDKNINEDKNQLPLTLKSKPIKHLPSDLKILKLIYNRYYNSFSSFSQELPQRSSKIMVPIDLNEIANELKVDSDIIFGRLYYHLEQRHGYTRDNGTKVAFFSLSAGSDKHCVNFPMLASVLANLHDDATRYQGATYIALFSLLISILALIF